MEKILDRFLRYVSVETTSDENSSSQPSTKCQFKLLEMLRDELLAMGLQAELDEYGYVMTSIPTNINNKDVPAIGFIAHVDTSPDASGKNIKPQIVKNYDGGDIILNAKKDIKLSVDEFPEMKQYKGQRVSTTDGPTL